MRLSALMMTAFAVGISGCVSTAQPKVLEKGEEGQVIHLKPQVHLLVAAAMSTEEEVRFTTMLLSGVRRNANRYEILSLDRLVKDGVEIFYSNASGRGPIDEFSKHHVTVMSSSNKALAASLKRVNDYGENISQKSRLVAVIVTSGTSEPGAISELQGITKKIPSSVSLYMAGVSPKHRNAFSSVVHPIRDRAQVFGQGTAAVSSLLESLSEVKR
jgi:hypothetical protein